MYTEWKQYETYPIPTGMSLKVSSSGELIRKRSGTDNQWRAVVVNSKRIHVNVMITEWDDKNNLVATIVDEECKRLLVCSDAPIDCLPDEDSCSVGNESSYLNTTGLTIEAELVDDGKAKTNEKVSS
ncbi:hypothetical protein B9Z55_028948 [Caenorhabditis nigoni]|nr:hypothetical protein B9Z55_028948 [Caenorhabditis nigoni]